MYKELVIVAAVVVAACWLFDTSVEYEKPKEDPYHVLGLKKDATQKEIKQAYRKKSLQLPSRVTDQEKENAMKIFAKYSDAYEILANEEKKALYDKFGIIEKQSPQPKDPFQFFKFNFGRPTEETENPQQTHQFRKMQEENK